VDPERGKRLRSFVLGGLIGSAAALAAAGRARVRERSDHPRKRTTPAGLAAFEQAPCYEEVVAREDGGDRTAP
jgi:hypothetical protein